MSKMNEELTIPKHQSAVQTSLIESINDMNRQQGGNKPALQLPPMVRDDRDLMPWPVIQTPSQKRDAVNCIKQLPQIMLKAIKCFFNSDQALFEEYLELPGWVLGYLENQGEFFLHGLISRHDVVFSDGVLKLLEVNAGSVIGGFDHDLVGPQVMAILRSYTKINTKQLHYEKIVTALLKGIHDKTMSLSKGVTAPKILFLSTEMSETECEAFGGWLNLVYQAIPGTSGGELLITPHLDKIDYSSDVVTFDGMEVDAVIVPMVDVPEALQQPLFDKYVKGQVYFPDNVLHRCYGDKVLMAVLHEDKVKAELSKEDVDFINRYVPHTVRITSGSAAQRTHILQNKDSLVLKKTGSMQGRDVSVGCFTSDEGWAEYLDDLSKTTGWIMQEYCVPDEVVIANGDSRVARYSPVWGYFDIASRYGGGLVRAVELNVGNGVINSHNGAKEFVLLDIQGMRI